jgi:K+-sensing histidine kinase KdpD
MPFKFKSLTPLFYSLGFVTVASLIFDVLTPWLDVPILAMGYLLLVLFASMRLSYWGALLTAIFSFIALNFFFIEPRYTLQVARLQSLLELLGFLAVSITMVSIMERLKTVMVKYFRKEFKLLSLKFPYALQGFGNLAPS